MSAVFRGLKSLFSLDKRSLALFRVALGLLLIWDVYDRSSDVVAHYSDYGVLPVADAIELETADGLKSDRKFSLYFLSGEPWLARCLLLLTCIASTSLTFGFYSRVSTVLCWMLIHSLHYRNPLLLSRGDDLLRLLLLWSMFVPLGCHFSLDALLQAEQQGKALPHQRRPSSRPPPGPASMLFSIGTIGLVLQAGCVFVTGALLRSGWSDWYDGTAVYYILSLDLVRRPLLGGWLLSQPALTRVITAFVVLLERVYPAVLILPVTLSQQQQQQQEQQQQQQQQQQQHGHQQWRRTRSTVRPINMCFVFLAALKTCAIIVAVSFFLLCPLFVDIGLVPWVFALASLPLIPPQFWSVFLPLLFRGQQSRGRNTTATTSPSILSSATPRLFFFLAFVGEIASRIFRIRREAPVPSTTPSPNSSTTPAALRRIFSALLTVLVACLVVLMVTWNVCTVLSTPHQILPRPVRLAGPVIGLSQKWDVYSPHAPRDGGGWWNVSYTPDGGPAFDLLDPHRPPNTLHRLPNHRWKMYMDHLFKDCRTELQTKKNSKRYLDLFTAYMCRRGRSTTVGARSTSLHVGRVVSVASFPSSIPQRETEHVLYQGKCS